MYTYITTPTCARCSKAVYAAEQVIGPGRKVYHKPCLTCSSCRTRLDSYKLVEHDLEPYCKPCHMKHFGTVDLRHANLPTSSSVTPTQANSSKAEDEGQWQDGLENQSMLGNHDERAEMAKPVKFEESVSPERPRATVNSESPTMLKRLTPHSTGSSSSPNRWHPPQRTICPACHKAVYFAEQVKASGQTWHKLCLKCTECKTRLDSSRLTEKDGLVFCRNCYGKLHGPQGEGYALVGRRMG